jgi:CelD/BcsL family acetyltransferase involved in cellulose biosynthesis
VKVTVLDEIPEDPEIVLAWNNLVSRMARPEIFFTQQWASAASHAFSDTLRPLTFLVHEFGELRGVAAMAVTRESLHSAFFLTASTADYCDILSAPEARPAVFAALLDEMNKRSIRDLVFANVPAESNTLQAIAAAAPSRGFHIHDRPGYDCGIIALGDDEQRRSVLQSVMRKEHEKRGLKKLGRLGPVQVTHLVAQFNAEKNAKELESALEPIFAAQILRFLATNRVSPLTYSPRRHFLTELARLMSSAGWLKISQLEVGGKPVAWNYGFRFFDSWFWYLPTFQMQYEESSPGSCLLRLLTEEACADPSVKRLDLGLGGEAYKERFSSAVSSTRYVKLSKSRTRHLLTVGRNKLAASAEKLPILDRQLRGGREVFHSIKTRMNQMGLAAITTRTLTKVKRTVTSEDEIAFFEAPHIEISDGSAVLKALTWGDIAPAALHSADDDQTLKYLGRCAQRMRDRSATGYFLPGQQAQPAHFLWLRSYDGFVLSEIDSTLESNHASAMRMMIFDCWTPAAQRGHGHYTTAIRLAAAEIQKQQKQAWIFSATSNKSSIRGIIKAGFVYRFSLVRSRKLFHTTMSRREDTSSLHDWGTNK